MDAEVATSVCELEAAAAARGFDAAERLLDFDADMVAPVLVRVRSPGRYLAPRRA
jgi:hypothetical protein